VETDPGESRAEAARSCQDYAPKLITLRDGRRLMLRPLEPGDKDALEAAFHKLSEEARYMRFMAPLEHVPPRMLERAVRPVGDQELALVAVEVGGTGAIVGAARYVADPSRPTCECAVAIDDDWHRLGLASRLLAELIQSARSRGLRCMEGFVLAGNAPMLALARRLGFEVTRSDEGPSVRHIRLDL
jgi:RimJ/RimL family protein N-acetyltransferase